MFKRKTTSSSSGPEIARIDFGPARRPAEVIREIASRRQPQTMVLDADGQQYTLLFDAEGLIAASGGGLFGPQALIAAVLGAGGSCTVKEGWPVARPAYQVGLNAILQQFVEGVVPQLPAAAEDPFARRVQAPVPTPIPRPTPLTPPLLPPATPPTTPTPTAAARPP